MPTVPGRSAPIGSRLGYVLEHTKRCSTLLFGPIGPCRHGEKASGKLALWGTISGSVDVGTGYKDPGTKGKDCRTMSRWISHTWNGEIMAIIGTAA